MWESIPGIIYFSYKDFNVWKKRTGISDTESKECESDFSSTVVPLCTHEAIIVNMYSWIPVYTRKFSLKQFNLIFWCDNGRKLITVTMQPAVVAFQLMSLTLLIFKWPAKWPREVASVESHLYWTHALHFTRWLTYIWHITTKAENQLTRQQLVTFFERLLSLKRWVIIYTVSKSWFFRGNPVTWILK